MNQSAVENSIVVSSPPHPKMSKLSSTSPISHSHKLRGKNNQGGNSPLPVRLPPLLYSLLSPKWPYPIPSEITRLCCPLATPVFPTDILAVANVEFQQVHNCFITVFSVTSQIAARLDLIIAESEWGSYCHSRSFLSSSKDQLPVPKSF